MEVNPYQSPEFPDDRPDPRRKRSGVRRVTDAAVALGGGFAYTFFYVMFAVMVAASIAVYAVGSGACVLVLSYGDLGSSALSLGAGVWSAVSAYLDETE